MFLQVMKRKLWLALIWSVMAMAGEQALAANNVIVISGIGKVNTKHVVTIEYVLDGIREGLRSGGIVPEFQYVELLAIDEGIRDGVGSAALALAMSHKPDLVITLTDDALKYIGTKIKDIPVVFSWIFDNPYSLGLPMPNITGVTRGSHAASNWALGKKLTGATTVTMLSKNNASMQGAKQLLEANKKKLEIATGVKLVDIQLVDRFSEWAEAVKNCQSKMIYLADTSLIDRNGPMTCEEIVHWTMANTPVPVIAAAEKDVKAGALMAFISDDKAMGLRTADLALKILNGAKPLDIPYAATSKAVLVINRSTAKKYGIVLSNAILSGGTKFYD